MTDEGAIRIRPDETGSVEKKTPADSLAMYVEMARALREAESKQHDPLQRDRRGACRARFVRATT